MNKQNQILKRGRPKKDAAFVLRDQYWALYLKNKTPNESFASLERELLPHLRITRRQDGEGHSQPFALSKVARGKRGLSPDLREPPTVVQSAERSIAGATAVYTSILWAALVRPVTTAARASYGGTIAPEVTNRLSERHFSTPSAAHDGIRQLNLYGIRRIARLRHRDALGMLLCYCPAAIDISTLSLTAEAYIFHVLDWACYCDTALMAVKNELTYLIEDRYRVKRETRNATTARLFLAPKLGSLALGLRMLLGPRP